MPRLLYLSGAPRVSTQSNASASGPRAHILGVIKGFTQNGFDVDKAIAGDIINIDKSSSDNSAKKLSGSFPKRLVADVFRIFYRYYFRSRFSNSSIGEYTLVYERLAAMQSLGSSFKKKGIPWILETNAPLFYEANKERKSTVLPRLLKYYEIKAYRECTYLVCVSEKLKEIILKEVNLPEEKIIVMPNGVDIKKFSSESVVRKISYPEFTIGFVGTVQPWQKLDFLMQAFAELVHSGLKMKLLIVGDGIDIDRLKKVADTLKIQDHVTFTGRVLWEEIPGYIKSFDVGYTAPEAMKIGLYVSPLKLYEYMATGIPALASSSEDALHIINHNENGFLFKHGDVGSLKSVITDIYHNRSNLPVIGRKAKETIIESHSWESRVKKLLEKVKLN